MASRSSGSLLITLRGCGNASSSTNGKEIIPVISHTTEVLEDNGPPRSHRDQAGNNFGERFGLTSAAADLDFGILPSAPDSAGLVSEIALSSDASIWCQSCKVFLDGPCLSHGRVVKDRPYVPQALVTLPAGLDVQPIPGVANGKGVFAVVAISTLSIFGPLRAPILQRTDGFPVGFYLVATDGTLQALDLRSDDLCNWMKFVRMARNRQEQNVMAYQRSEAIYFTTMRTIQEGEELRVWYSRNYATAIGKPLVCDLPTAGEIGNSLPELSDDLTYPPSEAPSVGPVKRKRGRPRKTLPQPTAAPIRRVSMPIEVETEPDVIPPIQTEVPISAPIETAPVEQVKRRRGRPMKILKRGPRGPYKKKNTEPPKKRIRVKRVSTNIPSLAVAHYRCKCPEADCAMQFRTTALLNIHALRHGTAQNLEEITLVCPACALSELETLDDLLAHVEQRHSKQLGCRDRSDFPCPHCKKYYSSAENLELHIRRLHTEPARERNFECDTCHDKFVSVGSMVAHRRTHFNRRYFTCPVCLKTFRTASHLKEHSEGHARNGLFHCHFCEKAFERFPSLRHHLRQTHATGHFECDKCSMVFNRQSRLDAHAVTHSDTCDHMCDQCGRQFKRKDKLRDHILAIHQNVQIGRRFRKSALEIRMANVRRRAREKDYREYEYQCEPCKVGFVRPTLLQRHMAELHSETALREPATELIPPEVGRCIPCQYCGQAYGSKAKCASHIKQAHPETLVYELGGGDCESSSGGPSGSQGSMEQAGPWIY
ncbi:putative PR domain zinc finger protein 10 [Hypsibius exemplaris]|uniref:PR domain zinc finger protein 10 n=1 Tax=Hypsibius exemplaris TaxID=2072580 RepID=A0A1W0WMP2_HYPEX|nr:putative PR domain zinc finger protein 10 [Hypsibius exemplaris]